jgi:hypothetical protein
VQTIPFTAYSYRLFWRTFLLKEGVWVVEILILLFLLLNYLIEEAEFCETRKLYCQRLDNAGFGQAFS